MSDPIASLGRLPANGKFWLKRARVAAADLDLDLDLDGGGPAAGPDGTLLADLRVEEGRIRAVLPAGEAPCCAPGPDLGGAALRPLAADGRIGPGQPADLLLITGDGRRVEIRGGEFRGGRAGAAAESR